MVDTLPLAYSPFVLTMAGIFTAWSTFFLILSDRYLQRVNQSGIANAILRSRLYSMERFIFTHILVLIVIFVLLVFSPVLSVIIGRFLSFSENPISYAICGLCYLVLAIDSIFIFSIAYNVNRFHRSLRHDLRSLEIFKSLEADLIDYE